MIEQILAVISIIVCLCIIGVSMWGIFEVRAMLKRMDEWHK